MLVYYTYKLGVAKRTSDVYAIALKNHIGTVVGHIPRAISAVCSLFLRRCSTIVCELTGNRRASVGLPLSGAKFLRLALICEKCVNYAPQNFGSIQRIQVALYTVYLQVQP